MQRRRLLWIVCCLAGALSAGCSDEPDADDRPTGPWQKLSCRIDVPPDSSDLIAQRVLHVLRLRIDPYAKAGYRWRQPAPDRVEVLVPADQVDAVRRLIETAGVLEFRIAPRDPATAGGAASLLTAGEVRRYRQGLQQNGPAATGADSEYRWFRLVENYRKDARWGLIVAKHDGAEYVLLGNTATTSMRRRPDLPLWDVTSAKLTFDQDGSPAVDLRLDERGGRLLHRLSQNHSARTGGLGRCLAVLLDDVVYTAPRLNDAISDRAILTGNFSAAEVDELIRLLNAGVLPAPVRLESVTPVTR